MRRRSDGTLTRDPTGLGEALERLRVSRPLAGYRGQPRVDRTPIIETLSRLVDHVLEHSDEIVEIEINPLFVLRDRVCAIDALVRVQSLRVG